MRRKKNAFTLIELIAVLVILAIIALIATPLVMNIVKKARVSADKRSVDGYGKAVELAIASSRLDGKKITTDRYHSKKDTNGKVIYDSEENEIYNIEYSGNDVYCDVIDKNEDGSIYVKDCYVNGKLVEYTYGDQQINMLMQVKDKYLNEGEFTTPTEFLSTGIDPTKIMNLNIVNSIHIPDGYSSSDCSAAQDKSVMCWWIKNGDYYDMYIGADGVVYAPKNATKLFAGVGNEAMTSFDLGNYFDTSYTNNMNAMLMRVGGNSMINFNLGSSFDSSNVKTMRGMFYSFNGRSLSGLFLEKFDTSSVTDMSNMFYWMSATAIDLGDKFDSSKVTNMASMFYGCDPKLFNIGNNFDTSNVEDMSYMFWLFGANNIKEFNLGNKFDTSKVKTMRGMFMNMARYSDLKMLDLGDKFDTSNVEDMSGMFSSCGVESLTILNLGDKFDTSNVKDMSDMFRFVGQEAMISLDLGDKFDTSSAQNISGMFRYSGEKSLKTLNLGNFGVNRSNITNYSSLFGGTGESTLNRVKVANDDVRTWLKGMDSDDVPYYVKDAMW